MKNSAINFIILTLTLIFRVQSVAQSSDSESTSNPTLSPVEVLGQNFASLPNVYRTYFLNQIPNGLTGMRINLEGAWTDDQTQHLSALLKDLNARRPTRDAEIREWTIRHEVVFSIGESFEYTQHIERIPNPAAVWGSGISEIVTQKFQIPSTFTQAQFQATVGPHLPEILIKDPAVRQRRQNRLAAGLRGDSVSVGKAICEVIIKGSRSYE